MSLMRMGLPSRLLSVSYASDASSLLQTVPTIGGFNAQNLVSSLNESPHLSFQYRNFASCGPGSRRFLQRIFGKTAINSPAMEEAGLRWLYVNQWRFWKGIEVDPPHAWELGLRPGMRVMDIENALCWCHRYVNDITKFGFGNLGQVPDPTRHAQGEEECGPPAWCDEESHVQSASRVAWEGDYGEVKQRVESLGDEVYEVEKIVARKGDKGLRNGLFRVRWKGWMPEDDTWERESELRNDAGEVSEVMIASIGLLMVQLRLWTIGWIGRRKWLVQCQKSRRSIHLRIPLRKERRDCNPFMLQNGPTLVVQRYYHLRGLQSGSKLRLDVMQWRDPWWSRGRELCIPKSV